ncbi:MAG: molybdopterin-dependent oxidoreductase [Tabrizicola sp.]
MFAFLKHSIVATAVAVIAASPVLAEDLPAPTGEILLTVAGDFPVKNQGDTAVFDAEMLKAIGEVSFQTSTPWTEDEQTFTGVSLHRLMERLEITEGTLKATAINDYAIDIPVSDAVEGGPILAYLQNGEPMSVREKGPLWVVYPYDLKAEYQTEVTFSRSIWQLVRLDLVAN